MSVSVTAGSTISGSATPSGPAGQSGTPAPIVKEEVAVTLDAGDYRVGAMIQATVHNGIDRPVYTEDFKTACSIVILQRQEGQAWTDILGCRLGRPTATVTIEPGMSQTVELDPASFHLANDSSRPGFGAGTYRVKFTFRVDPVVGGEDPLAAYSPAFPVR